MRKVIKTREEKLKDKQSQLRRMGENNIAWNYVNNRLRRENERLSCRLEYLEKMEQEIVETVGEKNGFGIIKI